MRRDQSHALAVTGLLARSGALGPEPLDYATKRERRAGLAARDMYEHSWEAAFDLEEYKSKESLDASPAAPSGGLPTDDRHRATDTASA